MTESSLSPSPAQASTGAALPQISGTIAAVITGVDEAGVWHGGAARGNGAGYGRLPDQAARQTAKIAQPKARPPLTMHFPCTDEAGIPLSREVRLQYADGRKQTWQEAADPDRPGKWITGHGCMTGVRRVPFELAKLNEGLRKGETNFIVEGPRKCGPLHARPASTQWPSNRSSKRRWCRTESRRNNSPARKKE